MPLFISLLLFTLIPGVAAAKASDCAADAAGYDFVTEQWRDGALRRSIPWEWIPRDSQVLYVYPQSQIAERWSVLSHGRVRLERAFLNVNRGIAYEPADLQSIQAEGDWDQLRKPVSSELLAQLEKTGTEGSGCKRIDTYTGQIDGIHYDIQWVVAGGYPQQLVSRQHHSEVRQRLERRLTVVDVDAITQQMGEVDYMDFADIGDNEADPFVLQLIGMGFVEHGAHSDAVAYPGHDH